VSNGYAILQACIQPANIKDNPFSVLLMFRKIGDMMISVKVAFLFEKRLKNLCKYNYVFWKEVHTLLKTHI
jgi:hypothetical protein